MTTSKISHFLLKLYIIKSYNFDPTSAFNYEFHTLSYPTIFLTACRRSKECLSIPVGTQENLQPILFVPLINIRNKKIKSWIHPDSLPWIKTGTSYLTTLLPFPPSHLITLLPFPPSHLTNLSPTLFSPEAIQHNLVLELHTHFLE